MSVQTPVREALTPPGSLEEWRERIAGAFYQQRQPSADGGYAYVCGTYPDDGYVIVAVENIARPTAYYRHDFTVGEDGAITFGAAIPLEVQLVPAQAVESASRQIAIRRATTPRATLAEGRLAEAARQGDGSTLNVTIIRAGFNTSRRRYYDAEALRAGAPLFAGAKMYANHMTEAEERTRPEGDVWQWVGILTETVWDDATQSIRGVAKLVDPQFRDKVAMLDEAGQLNALGISIRAIGSGKPDAEVEGFSTFRVEEFVRVLSVDFVTEPGAGGHVEFREADDALDVHALTLATFREQRPDIVEALIHEHEQQQHKEAEMSEEELRAARARAEAAERDLAAANEARQTAESRAAAAEGALQEAQAAAALQAAQVEIGRLIAEAGLPEVSVAHLRESLATETSVEAATARIAEHRQLVEALRGTKSPVVGNGARPSEGGSAPAGTHSLRESFARIPGLTEDAAAIAAQGGR